jgi:hypothetical protein
MSEISSWSGTPLFTTFHCSSVGVEFEQDSTAWFTWTGSLCGAGLVWSESSKLVLLKCLASGWAAGLLGPSPSVWSLQQTTHVNLLHGWGAPKVNTPKTGVKTARVWRPALEACMAFHFHHILLHDTGTKSSETQERFSLMKGVCVAILNPPASLDVPSVVPCHCPLDFSHPTWLS